jgi:hypothetical protein
VTSLPPSDLPPATGSGLKARALAFYQRHGKKLWWAHSFYALLMGLSVIAFAKQGFEHAQLLSVSACAAWLLVVLFFRFAHKGKTADGLPSQTNETRGFAFYAMTYALKNLYQGMLFFLLPFYFKSASYDAWNFASVFVLGACALLSTLDVVFDRVLMRFPIVGSLFHGLTLFACLNLIVPALLPDTRTLTCEVIAAVLAVLSFFSIHLRVQWFRKPIIPFAIALTIGLAGYGVTRLKNIMPPVPMYITHAAVGPSIREDGTLTMEVTTLDVKSLQRLVAVTDVVLPAGKGDTLVHIWRRTLAEAVFESREETSRVPGATGGVRLRSTLSRIPKPANGTWTVDVETADGQLVGRARFKVVP